MIILYIIGCLVAASVLAIRESGLKVWAGAVAVAALLMMILFGFSVWQLLVWALVGVLAALTVDDVRKRFLTGPVFSIIKRILPKMSDTEREALNAGTVWFDGDLFSGKPDWSRVRDLPKPSVSKREQDFIDNEVNELCEMLDTWQIDQDRDLPPAVWDYMGKKGFFSMIIPQEYGGLGFSNQATSNALTKVCGRDVTAGVTVMVPNSLGPGELLMKFGTQEQRDHWLPRLADGRELPCFGLTGPWAGSDAAAMRDYGVVTKGKYKGKTVLGISLTWEKRYITLGPKSTVLGLAFKLEDPDNLLDNKEAEGISLALIPCDHPGVNIGRRHLPADQGFMNGPNSGKDVFIPMEFVIGGEEMLGKGWSMLMTALAAGRAITLPGTGTASARGAAVSTSAYGRTRKQFDIPVGMMEGVAEKVADITGLAYGNEATRRMTNIALDQGHKPSVISAMWKYEATERGRMAIEQAMDVHGGKAICNGPSNYLYSAYKAVPVGITVEGANILTRSLITFGQGAVRSHPWLQAEMEAAEANDLDAFDEAFCNHVKHVAANKNRAMAYNFSGGLLAPGVKGAGKANYWYKQLSRQAANFGYLVDIALATMGGALKQKQMISGRYADAFGELYIMTSVLKRWEDEGKPAEDWPLVEYCMRRGMFNLQQAFDGILVNHPIRPLTWALRLQVFPWGRNWRKPGDKLKMKVVGLMMAPSATRARVGEGLFVSSSESDSINQLERAFKEVQETDKLEKRIRKAVKAGKVQRTDKPQEQRQLAHEAGIITASELDRLEEYEKLLRKVIDVDDFSYEELSPRLAGLSHNQGGPAPKPSAKAA